MFKTKPILYTIKPQIVSYSPSDTMEFLGNIIPVF